MRFVGVKVFLPCRETQALVRTFQLSRLEQKGYLTDFLASKFLTQGHFIVGRHARIETHSWLNPKMLGLICLPLLLGGGGLKRRVINSNLPTRYCLKGKPLHHRPGFHFSVTYPIPGYFWARRERERESFNIAVSFIMVFWSCHLAATRNIVSESKGCNHFVIWLIKISSDLSYKQNNSNFN